jgi:hypothetical protein
MVSGTANVALAAGGRSRADFAPIEVRRLAWLRATHLAEAHLERAGLPADRAACQHLAFGLWLRATGRISEELGSLEPGAAQVTARLMPGA